MAEVNQYAIAAEAEQYLSRMKLKLQSESRSWERFAGEVPDKFMQLVKSGLKPTISRGDGGYSSGGGRTLSVSLNFEANMDAAKNYLESLKKDVPRKGEAFHKVIDEFDKKLEHYHANGLDGELFEKLAKHFGQWVDYAKELHVQIRDAKITVELPKKYLDRKKYWGELADKNKLEEDAKRYGIAVEDVPRHRTYLAAKQKKAGARTAAAMQQAAKEFGLIASYLDASELKKACEAEAAELKQKEEEAERLRKQKEEEERRAEEARRKAEIQAVKATRERLYDQAKKQLESACEAEIRKQEKQCAKKLEEAENTRKQLEEEQKILNDRLPTLGFFKFSEKKQTRLRLEAISLALIGNQQEADQLEPECRKKVKELKDKLGRDLESKKREIERANPMPAEPKPASSRSTSSSQGSAVYQANQTIKQAILDGMAYGEKYRISELMEEIPMLADLSTVRVSAMLRQLVSEGKVERTELNRIAYFSLA